MGWPIIFDNPGISLWWNMPLVKKKHSRMEHLKDFLDASTIHGLAWISSTRRWFRLFWILIIIAGFSMAGFLIHESFYNWKQSPISTTVETVSISKITFPNVTVCPPKNLFLNLNYEL